jgi:hypothetical protein
MAAHDWLMAGEIRGIFAEEIEAAGGTVTEAIDAQGTLLARSVLPRTREVGKNDRVQGGVALRATDQEILVHPYVFRQVCSNGAIRAHAIQTRRIERADSSTYGEPEVAEALREAVRASCSAEALEGGVAEMRAARHDEADLILGLMPMLAKLPPGCAGQVLASITRRYTESRDRTRFGLMNAVTSVARDTRDPELRWRLEELGGGIPVVRPEPHPRFNRPAVRDVALV